jgi:hypothetical protein
LAVWSTLTIGGTVAAGIVGATVASVAGSAATAATSAATTATLFTLLGLIVAGGGVVVLRVALVTLLIGGSAVCVGRIFCQGHGLFGGKGESIGFGFLRHERTIVAFGLGRLGVCTTG